MGIMIIPFVSSLSDDVIRSVPKKLKDGALAVGATRAEVMQDIVLPTAFPGLMAAMLLAVSRAIGETMIVVMAAGERANLTLDPFQDVTTVTVQIVALLTGDPEFDSPRTLSAFALGAVLFTLTLAFNAVAQWIVDRQKGVMPVSDVTTVSSSANRPDRFAVSMSRRRRKNVRFHLYGLLAIAIAFALADRSRHVGRSGSAVRRHTP